MFKKHNPKNVEIISDELGCTPEELDAAINVLSRLIAMNHKSSRITDLVNDINATAFQPRVKLWMAFKGAQAIEMAKGPVGQLLYMMDTE
jgi:hypothetical protein